MNPINYQFIRHDAELVQVCARALQQTAVALDTEFMRIRSYYPKLGLIQLFDGEQVSLIDPTTISDFSPFVALLSAPHVTKVLHACGEDLEVFQHHFNQLPEPLMDTQVMASFVGLGASLGFAKLVAHYFALELDKGAARTDWLARPLSETQLQYAAADVWYLLPAYAKLSDIVTQSPWQAAIEEECQRLLSKRARDIDTHKAYLDIGNAWQLTPQQLAVLQVLAKWRVEEAQKRDLALNFVVKEQSLWELAKHQPKNTAAMLDFMHPNEVRIHGKKLLWLIEQAQKIEPQHYPEAIARLIDDPLYKQSLKRLQQKAAELTPAGLDSSLFASKRQLNQLFKWYQQGHPAEKLPELLQGWRQPIGAQLVAVLGDGAAA